MMVDVYVEVRVCWKRLLVLFSRLVFNCKVNASYHMLIHQSLMS